MTDQDILNHFVDLKRQKCIESRVKENYINKNPQYKDYLDNRYPEQFSKYSEVIARIYHKVDSIPVCKKCGKPLPFRTFSNPYRTWCNQKCQLTDEEFIKQRDDKVDKKQSAQKSKQTKLERYGDECFSNRDKAKQTMIERYGVENYMEAKDFKEKSKQTMIEKYGVENASKSTNFLNKIKQTKLERYGDANYTNIVKAKQTMIEKYGVENYMETKEFDIVRNSKEIKQKRAESIRKYYKENSKQFNDNRKNTSIERYGVESYSQTQEYKDRVYKSKKEHHTFNSSSIEKQIIEFLNEHNIIYKYQYKSEKYPFICDFYFPNKDLYLEIQGTWTHGGHPFDKNSKDDIEKVAMWKSKNTKFYNKAIEVWTVLDVKKRDFALKHNLNWKEIFSIDIDEIKMHLQRWNII